MRLPDDGPDVAVDLNFYRQNFQLEAILKAATQINLNYKLTIALNKLMFDKVNNLGTYEANGLKFKLS